MVQPDVVRTAANAYIEMARALDTDRYAKLLAPDAVRENPFGRLEGREAIVDSAKQRWSRLASGTVEVERVIVSGASAAISMTAKVTAHNGRSATIQGIDVIELNDAGQIQTLRMYYDIAEMQALLA